MIYDLKTALEMKLIKKFVSKLLGGKSSAKPAVPQSPAAGSHAKSASHKKSGESSVKTDAASPGSSGNGRRERGNRPRPQDGQNRRRRPEEGSGTEQPRGASAEGGRERRRRPGEGSGTGQPRGTEGGRERRPRSDEGRGAEPQRGAEGGRDRRPRPDEGRGAEPPRSARAEGARERWPRPGEGSGAEPPRGVSAENAREERRPRPDEGSGAEPPRGVSAEGGRERRPRPDDGSRSGPPPRRRDERRGRSGSDEGGGRINPRTGGVARPRSQEGQGPRGSNSSGARPGGAITAEENTRRLAAHAEWDSQSFKVDSAEGKRRFQDFDLPSEIMHAVSDLGFEYCTPIQSLSLEHALAGKNVAGKAQTGTGKTAAFLIAILTRYLRSPEKRMDKPGVPRALVIAPTRELVIQICKDAGDLGKYCGLRTLAIYGGMDYDRQKKEIQAEPIDLLVATPGRLLDYSRQRVIDLSQVDTLVIDEADRMLDMGFIPDVRVIMNRLPPKERRGTMLYSATLSEDVMRLASQWMEKPVHIEIESENMTTDTVEQVVYVVTASEKFTVLYNLLQQYPDTRILVFCNRKVTTEGIVRKLQRLNVSCDMLSGDVNQNRRLRVLEDFRDGKVRVVIATDVAGRGIHVDDVGFVVNYDFPYEAEDYVHRIGRTGRAGQEGTAISFADEDESFIIPEIEAYIKQPLKCTMLMGDHPLMADIPKFGRAHPPRTHERRPSAHPVSEGEPSLPPEGCAPAVEVTAESQAVCPTAEALQPADSRSLPAESSVKGSDPEAAPDAEPVAEVERGLENMTGAAPEAAPDAEPAAEVKRGLENKKGAEQKKFNRRGAPPRSSAPASARPARSPAPRARERAAEAEIHPTVPVNMAVKGPRFSDEWVPGQ